MTVLVIKLITTVNKTNYLVENLTKKAESLDNLFNVIDFTTNKFNQVGELIVGSLTGLVKKIFGGNSMVNVTISMSKKDYDYIMNELNMARQNTYIKHVHVQLDKKEIVERINVAYEQIGHVLDKLI